MSKKIFWAVLICIGVSLSQVFINHRFIETVPSVEIRLKLFPLVFLMVALTFPINIFLISVIVKVVGQTHTKITGILDRVILPYSICVLVSNILCAFLTYITDKLYIVNIPAYMAAPIFCYVIRDFLRKEIISKNRLYITFGLILLLCLMI